jgi:hypothetical protein
VVMSRDQNAGRCTKVDNSSIENVEVFRYLETNKKLNTVQKGNKNRLNSGNICYHSVQNI